MASVISDAPELHRDAEKIESARSRLEERIRRERRAVLVVNTMSRRGQAAFEDSKRLLIERGFTLDAAIAVRDPARLPAIVARFVAQAPPLVIVGGGDGTISAVVDYFAYKDVAFGFLPLGTANSFARTLTLPLDVPGAVDALVTGKLARIDLGRIGDDYFANAAAIGLQATIARTVPHGLKKALGRIGYLVVAAVMLARMKPFGCTVIIDSQAAQKFPNTLELRIANGAYKGGLLAAPEASVESHDLVVHIVRGRSVFTIAKVWTQIALGLAPSEQDVVRLRGARFRIETDPSLHVSIDGEALTCTPIEASVARQALWILVPQGREDLS